MKTKLLSEGELILKLHAVAQSLGRTPKAEDMRELSKKGRVASLDVYRAVFGAFSTALERARLVPRHDAEAEKQKLIAELRSLRKRVGRHLVAREVVAARRRGEVSSLYLFKQVFGSVHSAIEVAGTGTIFSREQMIQYLRKLDATLDHPVHTTDIQKRFRAGEGPSHRAVEREFGGMVKARHAAGIKNIYLTKRIGWSRGLLKYSREELISQLQQLAKQLGRKPTNRDIDAACKQRTCAASLTFGKVFGSLPEAYRAADFEPFAKTSRRYTDVEIIAAIEKLASEIGRMPTYGQLEAASRVGKCPNPSTIIKRIGRLRDLRSRFDGQGKRQTTE